MSCKIIRSKENGRLKKVLTASGEESKTFKKILEIVKKVDPAKSNELILNVKHLVGKAILNTFDPNEIALGVYINLHSTKFKSWFGDWTNNESVGLLNDQGEPEITEDDLLGSVVNKSTDKKTQYSKQPVLYSISATPASSHQKVKANTSQKLLFAINKTAQVLNTRIKKLNENLEKVKLDKTISQKDKLRQEIIIKKDIETTKTQRDTLKDNNKIDYVFAQAMVDLKYAKERLSDRASLTYKDTSYLRQIITSWGALKNILGVQDINDLTDAHKLQAEEITGQVANLEVLLYSVESSIAVEHGKARMDDFSSKDVTKLEELNWFVKNTLDISRTGQKFINYLADIINKLNLRIKKEHLDNEDSIKSAFSKIKNNPLFKKEGWKLFVKEQENTLKVKTLGLRGRYSQKYYDTFRIVLAKFRDEKEMAKGDYTKIQDAFKKLNKWIKENTQTFNLNVFIEENPDGTLKYSEAEQLKVIEDIKLFGFTSEEVADMLKEQNRLYNRFKVSRERAELKIVMTLEGLDDASKIIVLAGKTEELYIEEKMKFWSEQNSPIDYMSGKLNQGYRYTVKIPNKMVNGKDSEYYDENFKLISEDKDLYEFYRFTKEFLSEQLSYLPEHLVGDLQSNFLPIIAKEMAGEYAKLESKGWTNGLGDWFMKTFTSVDTVKEEIDPATGKVINRFNAAFIKDEVSVDDRTQDLTSMMSLFGNMALVYKHKLLMQDEINTINDMVQNTTETAKKDKVTGKVVMSPVPPKNLQESVQSAVLRAFYGKSPEREGVSKKKFYNTTELLSFGLIKSDNYRLAKKLEDKMKLINQKIDKGDLSEKELESLNRELGELQLEYKNLGGKQFTTSMFFDWLTKVTRLKGIGFNPTSAMRNLGVGEINNYIHAIGGEDFKQKNLRKAVQISLSSTARYLTWGNAKSKNAEKIFRLLNDAGVVDGEDNSFSKNKFGSNPTIERIKEIFPSPFGMMKSTDYAFKSHLLIAMMDHIKIKTSRGEKTFFEVLDENRKYNEADYGPWKPEDHDGLSFDEYYERFTSKYAQLAKRLHGFSGDAMSLAGKDSMWGRMAFVFRTWLPETFATRFEGRKEDLLLGRNVEGYYRTFFSAVSDHGFKAMSMIWDAVLETENGKKEMDEVTRANLRKVFTEFSIILGLAIMVATMIAMAPDDDGDEEETKYFNFAINQFIQLQRDLTYYSNPFSIEGIANSVFPTLQTILQAADALNAIGHYVFQVENEDEELMYDLERTLLKITKATPYLNNINRIKYQASKIL